MLFVNQKEYTAKVAAMPPMEEKNKGFDLQGWEYRSLPASDGSYTHRYYYHASDSPGAPVFLCIHGLNLDGRTYMHLAKLVAHWQLVAYDFPDRCPKYRGRFDDWREIVDDFVKQLPDSVAAVAGVSFGGGIAMHLAANNPRVKGRPLVLLSTTMIGADKAQQEQSHKTAAWLRPLPDYKIYWLMETLVKRNIKKLRPEEQQVLTILRMKHPDFYRQVASSLDGFNASLDAQKVTGRTLMLMGDRDELFKGDQEAAMRRYIPQLEYGVIKGGTHSMVYTRGPEVADSILAFCGRHGDLHAGK
jgi:pimeloyl-ACP methyl ester carboxylesterase